MTPKGGIRPHKRFAVQAKRSEVLFVDYIAEHLNPSGRAGVIVPEGIIFQSSNAYKTLRKMLVEDYLWAVVSLPAGVFNPYSGVKTSILLMDKTKAKQNDSILFIKVENDGFDLGAQRRPIDKNDLPEALNIIQSGNADDTEVAHWVEKSKIAESGDWNLSGERYRMIPDLSSVDYPIVKLKEVVLDYKDGGTPSRKNKDYFGGNINWCVVKDIKPEIWDTKEKLSELGLKNSSAKLWGIDSIIISLGATIGNVGIAKFPTATKQGLCGIVPDEEKIVVSFLAHLLRSRKDFINANATGVTIKEVRPSRLMDFFELPLPPLSLQEEIVAEIDGYQKIIDGAKQVVDNYKPTIKIDPNWEMVELGEVLKKSTDSINPQSQNGEVKYVGLENIEQNTGLIVGDLDTEISTIKSTKMKFKEGDVLYGKLRPNLNKVHYCNFEGICSTDIFVLLCDTEKANPVFYSNVLRNNAFNTEVLKGLSGAQLPRVGWNYFSSLIVPLPPLSVQKEIVTQIEAEQEMVNGNKKLIEIYEQKIKDKIGEVWGEKSEKEHSQIEETVPTKWRLDEGIVDTNEEYIKITYGSIDDGDFEPIALVAPGNNKTFTVQYLLQPEPENKEQQKMLDAVRKELNFYFLELKEKDPWAYACYHCTTAANLYSDIHWHYYPKGDKGKSEHHAEIIVL
jgi:type I restriction enzyme M protein